MAVASFSQCSSLLAMVVSVSALQINHEGNEKWNPLDIFRSESDPYAYSVSAALKPFVHIEGNRTTPRLLVSSGCDAASGIIAHAHNILALHGINTPEKKLRSLHDKVEGLLDNTDNRELVETNHTHDFACDDSCRAMVQTHKYFESLNRSLVFKGLIGGDSKAMLSKSLKDIGTNVAQTVRRNKLDQIICMIRDCSNSTDLGDAEQNGKSSDICWNRRTVKPTNYKANVKVTTLLDNIKHIETKEAKAGRDFKKMGYTLESVQAEDLLDFEWNKEAVGVALGAWSHLLKAWKVHPQEKHIKSYLEAKSGLWEAPKPHKETVANFDEIKNWINGHDRFSWMLRE